MYVLPRVWMRSSVTSKKWKVHQSNWKNARCQSAFFLSCFLLHIDLRYATWELTAWKLLRDPDDWDWDTVKLQVVSSRDSFILFEIRRPNHQQTTVNNSSSSPSKGCWNFLTPSLIESRDGLSFMWGTGNVWSMKHGRACFMEPRLPQFWLSGSEHRAFLSSSHNPNFDVSAKCLRHGKLACGFLATPRRSS